jgi:hypothetical protein
MEQLQQVGTVKPFKRITSDDLLSALKYKGSSYDNAG